MVVWRRGNHTRPEGLAITSAPWSGTKLRTNYGPRQPNSAHLSGQQWIPATSSSRSATEEARSGGQGVASSNLASPTSKRPCRNGFQTFPPLHQIAPDDHWDDHAGAAGEGR